MDSQATTITSLAAELTLEFIGGACLLAGTILRSLLAGRNLQSLLCLLAPSLGSVFAHLEIQFILKLCSFCCYFLLQSF
jgi:hypothetical protein